ncbi:Prefoldin subunit 1 [Acropora cervicornis]|uniref:Prefoldin subunit 1 n=1 Tax=Acropora cervicornis TaxID=6130 RepID=A0AAD9QRX7_ACRCE|nr:PREDICTED: prefoldin subunit 1-like [Acropora digitifera]XP_029187684.1 prefoldin subunit 1 [Acropora millepora]KAK2566422.1 Prefoldin subunit 1 [Acropora cervicornis]
MATTFDQELRKAFQELQGKVIETTQRVKIAEGQISQLKRNIAHARLTDQELASLSSDTKTYESIGRMFVLEPVSYIRKELEKKLQNNEEKIRSIEANKEYLQRSVKEHEDNIREMLASRPK